MEIVVVSTIVYVAIVATLCWILKAGPRCGWGPPPKE